MQIEAEKKKRPSESNLQILVFIVLLTLQHGIHNVTSTPSEASIFQVNQLEIDEHSTDEFFNLETNEYQNSDFFDDHKMQISNFGSIYFRTPDFQQQGSIYDQPVNVQHKKSKLNIDLLSKQHFILKNFTAFKENQNKEFIHNVISKAELLSKSNWRQIYKMKPTPKLQPQKHKFFIAKNSNWEVHLKSIRTHFMQKIFYKLWKVPTQTILKEFAFDGPQTLENKRKIKYFLQQELSQLDYESFPLKQQLYHSIIVSMIYTLDLAIKLDSLADDVLFQVLFKGIIAELFH